MNLLMFKSFWKYFHESRDLNPLSASVALYRNQSIDLQSKSIDWFLYEGNTGT